MSVKRCVFVESTGRRCGLNIFLPFHSKTWLHWSPSYIREPHEAVPPLKREPVPTEHQQDVVEAAHREDYPGRHGHEGPVDIENCPACAEDFERGWDALHDREVDTA